MFQICPVCDMQQDIEPYDFCQVCGHEWTSEEIRSSSPVPIERPLIPPALDAANSSATLSGLYNCEVCGEEKCSQPGICEVCLTPPTEDEIKSFGVDETPRQ